MPLIKQNVFQHASVSEMSRHRCFKVSTHYRHCVFRLDINCCEQWCSWCKHWQVSTPQHDYDFVFLFLQNSCFLI
jgi:hypothetical protein